MNKFLNFSNLSFDCKAFHESRKLSFDAADLFCRLFHSDSADSFWLDSSKLNDCAARYSIMGSMDGPNALSVLYDVATETLTVKRAEEEETRPVKDPLPVIENIISRFSDSGSVPEDIPFRGGVIGYFGYEAGSVVCARREWLSKTWDIALHQPDRFLVLDHDASVVHAIAFERPELDTGARQWIQGKLSTIGNDQGGVVQRRSAPIGTGERVRVHMRHDRSQYLQRIDAALEAIAAGESYEVCLTNELVSEPLQSEPLDIYLNLRTLNPAPYSGFITIGDIGVLCASPERFLHIDRVGNIETKPIKGTAPRSEDAEEDRRLATNLENDQKSRSENLMITDLLRNDFGKVCDYGSVTVPKLMNVESYQTVHQLVSTVRGKLAAGRTTFDAIRATFPGGSMTGAPKLRSLDIIDVLENGPRGIYSGCLGWIGADGSADLNIIIRTIVMQGGVASIGVGGAIVAMSDRVEEYDEMVLKARASLAALSLTETGAPDRYQLIERVSETEIDVRPPEPSEIGAILAIAVLELGVQLAQTEIERNELGELVRLRVVDRVNGNILVAVSPDERILGALTWSVCNSIRFIGRYARVDDIFIDPNAPRQEVEAHLMDAAVVRCAALGIAVDEMLKGAGTRPASK